MNYEQRQKAILDARTLEAGLALVNAQFDAMALHGITCQQCKLSPDCHAYAVAYSPQVCTLWHRKGD